MEWESNSRLLVYARKLKKLADKHIFGIFECVSKFQHVSPHSGNRLPFLLDGYVNIRQQKPSGSILIMEILVIVGHQMDSSNFLWEYSD